MSLQVWVPLIKDYKNYGLNDLQFTPINTTYTKSAADGKIGTTCYTNTSHTAGGLISNKKINLGQQLSMCCWVKFSTLMASSSLGGAMGGQHRYPTNTGMGLTIKYISDSTGYLSVNTGDGSNRTYNTYCGNTLLKANEWYHVCFTYDGKTIKFYLNGKEDGSHSYSNQLNKEDYVHLFSWSSNDTSYNATVHPNYQLVGYMNDFRIYNHTLTPKEIKEISKGLVAHYQLKGYGRTNYLKGAGIYTKQNPLIRHSNDVSHMNDSYVYHTSLSITIPTDGVYSFICNCDGIPSGHQTSNSQAASRLFGIFLQNTSTETHYNWGSYGIGATGERYGQFTLPAGTYKIRTNLYAADNINYTVKIWNLRIVKGTYSSHDIYQPHSADDLYSTLELNSTAEKDVSGYGNHGTKKGTLNVDVNAPRYGNCYIFSNSSYINCGRGAMVKDAITVSCWGYMDNWSDYASRRLASCTEGGGWNFEPNGEDAAKGMCFPVGTGTTSNTYLLAVANIPCKDLSSGWHMFTGTYDGYTSRIYIDGVLRGSSSSYSTKTPIFYNSTNSIFIGAEAAGNSSNAGGEYFNGKISDFRIYGTALSAEDIAEMYKVSESVDKQGILYASNFNEGEKTSFYKDGTVGTSSFNQQVAPAQDMKVMMLDDKSIWARLHWLDVSSDKAWFANDAEVNYCSLFNRYSNMKDVDKFKYDNQYEFLLTYPSIKKNFPHGYTQLDYIEATGTQYINTGVKDSALWQFDIQFMDTTTRQLMGYGGNGAEYWGMQVNGCYGIAEWNYIANTNGGQRDLVVHDFRNIGSNTVWVQNKTTGVSNQDVSQSEYVLFALGAGSYGCKARLYRCRCTQGSTLLRDFIPAKRNSDGAIGLFDIVNNNFYINNGSGSFVAGYKDKYIWLDYIESTGTQYINTKYSASEGFKGEVLFEYLTLNNNNGYIVGSHNLNSPYGRNGVGLNSSVLWELGTGDTCPSANSTPTVGTKYTLNFSTVKGNSYLDINGSRAITTSDNTSRSAYDVYVFYNQYSQNANVATTQGRLYSLKIYTHDDILVRDFAPCINPMGEVGLFDKVTKTFFGNEGSDNFIAGNKTSIPLYNRWIQTSSPNASAVSNFRAIETAWPKHNYGLRKNGTSSVYNCDTDSTWYTPIGQKSTWTSTQYIPAADESSQTETELWVRIDNSADTNLLKLYDKSISAFDFMEI